MDGKMLKYEFTNEEVKSLLQMVNRVQIVGVQAAQSLLTLVQKLQSPLNATDLEKDQLKALKDKYDKKTQDKKH